MNCDKAPFPWFGGKSKAASVVWAALGDVPHYVEPFAGSLAVLIGRPHLANRPYVSETVNDLDGFVVNVWRAIQMHPVEVAHAASWPVAEADKTARQCALLRWRDEVALDRLAGDPEWCDPTMAGWWLWAVAVQIGAFDGRGPWHAPDGRLVKQARGSSRKRQPGVSRKRPHISNNGQGVNHAGLRQPGVSRDRPHLGDDGQGVNRPGLRQPGVSALDALAYDGYHNVTMPGLIQWMRHLAARLRHVRILNGDWSRSVTTGAAHTIPVRQGKGPAGVFLDPPYDDAVRSGGLYVEDSGDVAAVCRDWARTVADDPKWRIVLAGYDTEHDATLAAEGWTAVEWAVDGWLTGGSLCGAERERERLWLSPHCLVGERAQPALFDA